MQTTATDETASPSLLATFIAEHAAQKPTSEPETALYAIAIELKALGCAKSAGVQALNAIAKAWGAAISVSDLVAMMRPGAATAATVATATRDSPNSPPAKPTQLVTLPGIGGALVDWILSRSHRKQPELAVAALLAFGGLVLGQKLCAPGTPSNLYILGEAGTGAGKDDARQSLKIVMHGLGMDLNVAESLASEAGLWSQLRHTPELLLLQDECGHLLQSVTDPRASSHLRGISTALLTLFQNSKSNAIGKCYADSEKNYVIHQPHLCVYGTTTPSTLWDGITRTQIADGLFPRFLYFKGRPLPQSEDCEPDTDPPRAVIERLKGFLARRSILEGSTGTSKRALWPFAPAALAALKALSRAYDARATDGHPLQDLWTRTLQKVKSVAAVMQLYADMDASEISLEAVESAARIVGVSTELLILDAGDHLADNDKETEVLKVLAIIRQAGEIARSSLLRRCRWLDSKRRDEIISGLEDDGEIELSSITTLGRAALLYSIRKVVV